jgi:hypothetical protein
MYSGHDFHCILNAGANTLDLEIGIIALDDFLEGYPFSGQLEYALHWNTRARNTRFAEMNVGVNEYSLFHPALLQLHIVKRRLLTRSGCISSTQQQLELPRRVHCLVLPVVVGEGRRLSGKRQRMESG